MQPITIATIIYFSSVVIPIQSEIIYIYNYDNFGELFHQGARWDYNIYKYEDIDKIFDTEYKGTNIGGAFTIYDSYSYSYALPFEGYLVDITASFYCGSTYPKDEGSLWINIDYHDEVNDGRFLCQERGWNYNYTWIPPSGAKYQNFTMTGIGAFNATMNKAYGFDELRITTSDTPPQLLQRDSNISSNDP